MKHLFRIVLAAFSLIVLVGCSKPEPLDVSNDPPKGGKAAPMSGTAPNAGAPAAPEGAKPEPQ